jgi:monomeric sarcosine oxidase
MTIKETVDVVVVGAGVFGAWTAYQLRLAGARVALLDAYGAGNSRASSGGESRIMRMGYGPDEIYTRMALRSVTLWKDLFEQMRSVDLFQSTGVLWLAREQDEYCNATLETLKRSNVPFERLGPGELGHRYPQLTTVTGSWGILEPRSGVLMARRAVQAAVARGQAVGVLYIEAAITPSETGAMADRGSRVDYLQTSGGLRIFARDFVFACGPWLPKLFPSLLAGLIHVTRQEVVFIGLPAGDDRFGAEKMPAWIDFNDLVYGIPNIDNRGFKIAIDRHGAQFDPDEGDRVISTSGLMAVREYLTERMPALAAAPITETRVCQYENTSNGDFLIDRHPSFENVWLVGGGSGHGFKHGPVVGELVASLITERTQVEPRFAFATKENVQLRKVF